MSFPRTALLVCAGLLLAVSVACGGDKKAESPASGQNNGSGGNALATSVDLSRTTSSIEQLKSFRFDVSMKLDFGDVSGSGGALGAALLGALGDIKVEGSYVAPDQMDIKMRLFGEDMSYVQIGDKAWVKEGSKWEATTPSAASGLGFSSPTDIFDDFLPSEVLKGGKTKKESMNGVDTTRYSFDKKALEALSKDVGEQVDLKDVSEANLDIWLSEANIPVKVLMVFAGKDEDGNKVSMKLETNLRDINSDSIKIKAPI